MNVLRFPFRTDLDEAEPPHSAQGPLTRKARLYGGLRGIKLGIHGQPRFFVHFFFAALVVAAGMAFRCPVVEWCLLAGCIGLVLIAELFHSTIEAIFKSLPPPAQIRARPCLDIAFGAVLVACTLAALIGSLIFLLRIQLLMAGMSGR